MAGLWDRHRTCSLLPLRGNSIFKRSSFVAAWMNTSNSAEWNERRSASGGQSRNTESMFHLLFERRADAVWLFDPSTATVVDCNQAAAALLRCASTADLIGKRAEELSTEATARIAQGLRYQIT